MLAVSERECEDTRVLAVSERGRVCIITDVGWEEVTGELCSDGRVSSQEFTEAVADKEEEFTLPETVGEEEEEEEEVL